MKRKISSIIALLICILVIPANKVSSQNSSNDPNIIIILADDLGYSDIGCYGGELNTPALDRLANEGLRLTHFQNSAMCVASRASLLSGEYWPKSLPEFENTPLLQEKLQEKGYHTALIGKWHLRGDPLDRGFDHFFGFLGGFSNHFKGSADYRLDRESFTSFGPDFYSSDNFSERAVQFINSHEVDQPDQPFFLYLSYQAPHNPLQAPKEDILKQRGKYSDGWQAIREERFKRQKEMGIVDRDASLPDYPENLPVWKSLSSEQRDLEDLRMSVYAAMVERMDLGIGKVMEALEKSGEADNTLILFMSDNGTDPFSVLDEAMLRQDKLPGDEESNWQPGTGWAYASVTPWRLYKISQHAGGVTSGAIAWFPDLISGSGDIDHSSLHVIDVFPTINELVHPESEMEVAGESFLPLLKGDSWQRKNPLYFQFMDNRAIRTEKWTMAEVDASGWELFDSQNDPMENENLAGDYPDVVDKLETQWLEWWKRESNNDDYVPKLTENSQHYEPQGDRGSGAEYIPTAMPEHLKDRYEYPGDDNSVRQDELKNSIKVFPNPVLSSHLFIDLPQEIPSGSVDIINSEGRVVLKADFENAQSGMLVSEFKSGVYFARIQVKDGVVTKKFLII